MKKINNDIQSVHNNQIILDKITSRIVKNQNVNKIILFGSHAYDSYSEDSDIDLIVVLNDDTLPSNYDEYMKIYLRVSSSILDIKKSIPIDLIVHTRKMHEKFIELKSMFSKEILERGKVLYEADH
ncbi:nucleotidyltransferase domain-containing protein [bacterium]|nr:nucleotidyltransferase domain-containing protein [bacterium]